MPCKIMMPVPHTVTPQARQVMNHILHYGEITPAIAQIELGVWRLAARIFELRQAGVPVKALKNYDHNCAVYYLDA